MSTKKATKRALLTSILAICLCLVMLIGSTFAWFTDTASTGVNKIVSGNLKVDIVKPEANAEGKYTSLEGEKLAWTQQQVKGESDDEMELKPVEAGKPLWEPGVRFLTQGFKIQNKGNLALKWKVEVNKGTKGATDKFDLLDVIDFYVVTEKDGKMGDAPLAAFEGKLEKADAVSDETYYIKGVMQTTAGNDYQNLTLDGITITVYATQLDYEYDSIDNKYDENAGYPGYPVDSLDTIKKAIESGYSHISIVGDINVDAEDNTDSSGWTAMYFSKNKYENMADKIVLDGDGKLTTNKMAVWAQSGVEVVINGGTYDNTENNTDGVQLIYANNDSKITINGGTFIMAGNEGGLTFNISNQQDGLGGTIIIKGGLFNQKPESGTAWQTQDNWDEATGTGIRVAEGYTINEETIDGATWYRVVAE